MKLILRLSASAILLLLSIQLLGQKTLKPTVTRLVDVSKEAVSKYKKSVTEYNRINQLIEEKDRSTVSKKEFDFWQKNEFVEINENPLRTGDFVGCSWYCAGSPQNIMASSFLQENKSIKYSAELVHDFNLETAWVTNKNDGIGETLSFQFNGSKSLGITRIEFYAGYFKSEALWEANSRVKKVKLLVNGKTTYFLELKNTMEAQVFELPSTVFLNQKDLTLTFEITEVYKGAKYNDLCISEINFDGVGDH